MQRLAAFGLVAGLLLLAPPAAALAIEAPTLEEGDRWVLEGTQESDQGSADVRLERTVAGTEEVTIDSGSYEAYVVEDTTRADAEVQATSVTSWQNTTSYRRTSDQAELRREVTREQSAQPGQRQRTIEWDEPCQFQDEWPLEAGQTWELSCSGTQEDSEGSSDVERSGEWKILREETVTVPAGTFDTLLQSNQTAREEGDKQFVYLAAETCAQPVLIERETDRGSLRLELQSYDCTPDQGGSDGSGETAGDGTGTEGDSDGSGDGDAGSGDGTETGGTQDSPGPGAAATALALLAGLAWSRRRR